MSKINCYRIFDKVYIVRPIKVRYVNFIIQYSIQFRMSHTETIVARPSSSSSRTDTGDHIFKHYFFPRNFVFGTSAIQIISAVLTVVVKVCWFKYLNFRAKNCLLTSFTRSGFLLKMILVQTFSMELSHFTLLYFWPFLEYSA